MLLRTRRSPATSSDRSIIHSAPRDHRPARTHRTPRRGRGLVSHCSIVVVLALLSDRPLHTQRTSSKASIRVHVMSLVTSLLKANSRTTRPKSAMRNKAPTVRKPSILLSVFGHAISTKSSCFFNVPLRKKTTSIDRDHQACYNPVLPEYSAVNLIFLYGLT